MNVVNSIVPHRNTCGTPIDALLCQYILMTYLIGLQRLQNFWTSMYRFCTSLLCQEGFQGWFGQIIQCKRIFGRCLCYHIFWTFKNVVSLNLLLGPCLSCVAQQFSRELQTVQGNVNRARIINFVCTSGFDSL